MKFSSETIWLALEISFVEVLKLWIQSHFNSVGMGGSWALIFSVTRTEQLLSMSLLSGLVALSWTWAERGLLLLFYLCPRVSPGCWLQLQLTCEAERESKKLTTGSSGLWLVGFFLCTFQGLLTLLLTEPPGFWVGGTGKVRSLLSSQNEHHSELCFLHFTEGKEHFESCCLF